MNSSPDRLVYRAFFTKAILAGALAGAFFMVPLKAAAQAPAQPAPPPPDTTTTQTPTGQSQTPPTAQPTSQPQGAPQASSQAPAKVHPISTASGGNAGRI